MSAYGGCFHRSMEAFRPGDALVVTDVQDDFLPGGRLAVPRGDEIVPLLDRAVRAAEAARIPVVATRDWHPPNHCSFHSRGGPWPEHCVQGTSGAELTAALRLPRSTVVVSKATNPEREAYSAFEGTELAKILTGLGIRRIVIGGLTTEYCVKSTVADARALGLDVLVLGDAIRAIDANPGDGGRAIADMIARGARVVHTGDFASTSAASATSSGATRTG